MAKNIGEIFRDGIRRGLSQAQIEAEVKRYWDAKRAKRKGKRMAKKCGWHHHHGKVEHCCWGHSPPKKRRAKKAVKRTKKRAGARRSPAKQRKLAKSRNAQAKKILHDLRKRGVR